MNPATVAAGRPTAFTTLISSFEGTPKSLNYFPALNVLENGSAPTVLMGPGLPGPGIISVSDVALELPIRRL